jgi:hypothetical protein
MLSARFPRKLSGGSKKWLRFVTSSVLFLTHLPILSAHPKEKLSQNRKKVRNFSGNHTKIGTYKGKTW